MGLQSSFYATNGTTRTFPSTKHIATKQHVAVYQKRVSDNVWELAQVTLYDLIGQSVVFDIAPSTSLYSQIEIRIADSASELATSLSDIAVVSGAIANVNTVATNITSVNTTSTNISAINNVSGIIVPNINEILLADTNAATAAAQAVIATTQAGTATTKAAEALASANAAALSYDSFDDRYLGVKTANPTLDNDGAVLLDGALYFNSISKQMRVWDGAIWSDSLTLTEASVSTLSNKTISNPVVTGTMSINGSNISQFAGVKNRIINGDMRIDQRNAGALVTLGNPNGYGADRWFSRNTTGTGVVNIQQSTIGTGFSVKSVATTAVTDLTTTKFVTGVQQRIEAANCYDLNGQSVAISFRLDCNWTGNLPVAVMNSAFTRSYVVNVAVTSGVNSYSVVVPLEAATVTTKGNGVGMLLTFGFCNEGINQTATTGAWIAGDILTSTTSTQWVKTLNNYINITDVQLERGTVVTPFERRPIGTELLMCQRYLPAYNGIGKFTTSAAFPSAIICRAYFSFQVTARVPPTGVSTPNISNIFITDEITIDAASTALGALSRSNTNGASVDFATVSATAGRIGMIYGTAVDSQLLFTGCEL